MKKLSKKQKFIAAGSAAVIIASGSGAAYAFWTSTGSGTGNGHTATAQTVTINVTSSSSGLYPGGPAVAVSGTFTTPNDAAIYVGQVTLAIDPTFDTGQATNPCTAADFTVSHQPTATNATVVTGNTWGGATISMVDSATNQDNCKNVNVPLVLTSN